MESTKWKFGKYSGKCAIEEFKKQAYTKDANDGLCYIKDATTTDIWDAAEKGSLEAVKLHYDLNPLTMNLKNKYNSTMVHYASAHGHLQVVEFFISKGAEIDAVNTCGWTPLIWASKNGHLPVMELLLDNGGNVNHRDNKKWTALYWAVNANDLNAVKLLTERGASQKLRDQDNRSPLDWARATHRPSIITYLSHCCYQL